MGSSTELSVTPSIGEPLQLECEDSSYKNWYTKNLQVMETPNEISTIVGAIRTLLISSFKASQAGIYSCIIQSTTDVAIFTLFSELIIYKSIYSV